MKSMTLARSLNKTSSTRSVTTVGLAFSLQQLFLTALVPEPGQQKAQFQTTRAALWPLWVLSIQQLMYLFGETVEVGGISLHLVQKNY